MTMQIQGVAMVVTGGGSGLGAATVRMLAERGARVTIMDVNEAAAAAVAAETGATFCRGEVSCERDVDAALSTGESRHGVARVLVNCAGIAPAEKAVSSDLLPQSIDQFRRVIEINLIGSFLMLSRFAARLMASPPDEEDRGLVINTASIAAFDGQIGHAAYASSKAGIVGMALPLAREFARAGIRVMTIAPGIFETPILTDIKAAADALAGRLLHPKRLGRPGEFAELVDAIIRNPMLNGECIRLDGAVRLPPR
jgi:NAD(P)-dependent dehydrogenase (short-subunit alcohol dehydrogenase family)